MTPAEKSGKVLQPRLRYFRSLLPFLLASLGYILIVLAWTMPLLEWQISDIVARVPSTHKAEIHPLWTTKFGEVLLDGRRFGARDVSVVRSAAPFSDNCANIDLVVNRSGSDQKVELKWLSASRFFESYYSTWGWIEIVLAAIFIWWFTVLREHRPVDHAIILTITAVTLDCILLIIWLSAFSVTHPHYNLTDDCYGSITLIATLSKTYFGPAAALLAGVCLQVGAIVLTFKMAQPKQRVSA